MDASVGERELDVLAALWQHGPGTVADVRAQLPDALAYNTVLTVLRNLEAKKLVGHTEEGRLHRYHAIVAQEQVRGTLVGRLVDKLFRGSAVDLVAHLMSNERVSARDRRALQTLLDANPAHAPPATATRGRSVGPARNAQKTRRP